MNNTPDLSNAYIPHTDVLAYCSSAETLASVRAAIEHPLMRRAKATLRTGVPDDALATLQPVKTPEILIIEDIGQDLGWLDRLAEICGPQTHLIVIGAVNDIATYRRLIRRGVSDYLFSPVSPALVVKTIADIFARDTSRRNSPVIGFFGAGGGNGTSFLVNSVAQILAEAPDTSVLLVDLDPYFGTQAAALEVDIGKSLAEALRLVQTIAAADLEKLVSEKSPNLHILSSQVPLDQSFEIAPDALIHILDLARTISDVVLLDIPSGWGPLQKSLVPYVNEAVFCATLGVESFQRCHSMMRFAEVARRQKSSPRVVVNRMGATDGQSVSLAEFRDYLSVTETLSLPDLSSQIALALRKGKSPVTVHGRNDLRTALWPLVDTIAPGRVSALTRAAPAKAAGSGILSRLAKLVHRPGTGL